MTPASRPAASNGVLLVVDVQNGFCHPDGSRPRAGRVLDGIDEVVPRIATAVGRARTLGTPVVFTRHAFGRGHLERGVLAARAAPTRDGLVRGTWDAALVEGIGRHRDDPVVDKTRLDAFQWTALEKVLQGLGATELTVCGVATNFCVESTVRSAMMRDYPVTVLEDCCASFTGRLHSIGVEVMRDCGFAAIRTLAGGAVGV